MLTISKPTLFGSDGMAVRGQCSHDSPGWQLRWFGDTPAPVLVWQGAFKTCRHLQASCANAAGIEEVTKMVQELLNSSSFTHFTTQPTDIYPTAGSEEAGKPERGGQQQIRKRRKKRRR